MTADERERLAQEIAAIGMRYVGASKAGAAAAAQLRADGERIKALEAGIQAFLDGDYERPVGKEWRSDGKPSKHDRCVHNVWMYEYCEACADLHFEDLLNAARERQGG